MDIIHRNPTDQALFYCNQFIVRPIVNYGHLDLDEYDLKQICDIIKEAITSYTTAQKLASNLGHYTKCWNVDWHWIAEHILHDYHLIDKAGGYFDTYGGDIEVYKTVDNTHSPKAMELYLTDPDNPKSEPKTFKLGELVQNGSNLGKQESQFKPTIGVTDFGFRKYFVGGNPELEELEHYYDNTYLHRKSRGMMWDEEQMRYVIDPKSITERQRWLASLVKVSITDDKGNVVETYGGEPETEPIERTTKKKPWWKRFLS